MPSAYRLPPLRDRIGPNVGVLFVGINPGVRSSLTGHHFAGYSNRFWRLLTESRLVPEPVTYLDDDRLPAWGFGVTNLIPRPTPGMSDLMPAEYDVGAGALLRKIRRRRPAIVALVGVTVWRALRKAVDGKTLTAAVRVGLQRPTDLGAALTRALPPGTRVFVLPNPSGRNANYSYREMLTAYRRLATLAGRLSTDGPRRQGGTEKTTSSNP